jgi:hypothetical protein
VARCTSGSHFRFATILGLALGLALAVATATATGPAMAREPETSAKPSYWQDRYRDLVTKAERLRAEVERERELYADANRRNYRRGSKRHVHREAGAKAAEELARVEAQLATIEDDARRAGTPRGWLHQIEMQLEDEARQPAVAAGPGDEGRNPLHLESEEDGEGADAAERNAGRNPLHLKKPDERGKMRNP